MRRMMARPLELLPLTPVRLRLTEVRPLSRKGEGSHTPSPSTGEGWGEGERARTAIHRRCFFA